MKPLLILLALSFSFAITRAADIAGDNLYISTNALIGYGNATWGPGSGDYNLVLGSDNIMGPSQNSLVVGVENYGLSAGSSMVIGQYNASPALGCALVVGAMDSSSIYDGFVAGFNNSLTGELQFGMGMGLISNNNTWDLYPATYIGQYNLPIPTGHPLLVIGNGTDANNRSNALVVMPNGDIQISKPQGDVSMGEFAP